MKTSFVQMCKKVWIDYELITPEIAAEMLKANTSNYRVLSESVVSRYVKDLQAGLWTYTTATIAFTSSGVLVDGQHRLNAIIRSGVSVWCFVLRNLPAEFTCDPNQDKGKMRSVAVYLSHEGLKNTNTVCAAIRVLDRLANTGKTSRFGGNTATDSQVLKCVEFMPGSFFDWVDTICAATAVKRIYACSVIVAFFYLAARHDEQEAIKFFDILARRTDASSLHPANALREQVLSNRKLIDANKFLALAFSAFTAAMRGDNRKLIRAFDIQMPSGSMQALKEFAEMLKPIE